MAATMSQMSVLNANPRSLPGPTLLHELVARKSTNGVSAIEHTFQDGSTQTVSYQQLHSKSDDLALRLRSFGPTRTSGNDKRCIVPLYIEQSPDLYISQLAISKSGGAFCPIALDAPEERIRFILQDIEAEVILTTLRLKQRLPALGAVHVICVDDDHATSSGGELPIEIDPSHPAYIMYTSGSTGQPKGVILSHSAATQALLAHNRHIPQFSRFLQFANPTFDVSVFEIFFPLFRGCSLVSCDRRQLLNDLPGVINRLQIDAAELTPSVASSLLCTRSSVPSLRLLLTIGEMLQRSVVEEFGGDSEDPGILYGMYGPTEATIHCTLQVAFGKSMTSNNIGVPLDSVSAFVVKPFDSGCSGVKILPLGEEGELAIGGYQLADGYLNRPEQTKAAFVHHPDYGRLYRTGDRARLLPSGVLECLGRISSGQVKLRGQRIELGEIEYAAKQTPGCRAVIADVIDGTLVTFCVCDNPSTTVDDFTQTCRKWLPAFMVPGSVVLLNALPYLASGKVDRKALRAQYSQVNHDPPSARTSLSPRAQKVVDLVSSMLHSSLEEGVPLQNAGMDSLSAIRIASRLRRKGLPQLDANDLLSVRSIGELAALVDNATSDSDRPMESSVHIPAGFSEFCKTALSHDLLSSCQDQVEDIYPCTPTQSAMLSVTRRDPQAYCNWVKLALGSQTDPAQVTNALVQLARHHQLLRAGFLQPGSQLADYAVVVWRNLLPSQIKQTEQFDYAFNLANEQDFLRPVLFQLRTVDDGYEILLQIHHALYDQWSLDILKADMFHLLRGQDLGEPRPFRTVAAFYASNNEAAQSDESFDFWRAQLQDFTVTKVPQLRGWKSQRGLARTPWQGSGIPTDALRAWSKQEGVSNPSLFQAAVAYMLGTYTGSSDVTFGLVLSGRHIALADVDTIFGPCLTTLPCRVDTSSTRTCSDLLAFIHSQNRAMQRHALTPLATIKHASNCDPGSSLFDTLFVWQDTSLPDPRGICVKELDSADYHEFNLVLEFEPAVDEITIRATYEQSFVPAEQITKLLQQIIDVAKYIMRHCGIPVTDLSSAFRPDLLSTANPAPTRCAPNSDMIDNIKRSMTGYRSAAAVLFASAIQEEVASTEVLTYGQMRSRVNKLARYLISRNVCSGDLVCICMEKSIDLYVAILATLAAGAGYLPILPETPQARVASILSQAKVKICLCDDTSAQMVSGVTTSPVTVMARLAVDEYSSDDVAAAYSENHIAYTVFTSGSTGKPKGVAVTRGNLAGNIAALTELYGVSPKGRLLQACSHAFDVSVFEIFFAFSTGMTLCAATKEVLYRDLEQSIRALAVTHLSLTPTVAALIDPVNVPTVRFLVTAGEAVTEAVHQRWAGRGLHQGYGPSETTNICTVNMHMSQEDMVGNIGPPFRNTSAFVIAPGEGLIVLPAGAVGEFAFGGEQVFRGYLGMDELNASKLIDHPKYGRIYKSGDVGRILADGTLFISGRIDDQVKIRGNRIELGEITALMLKDPHVLDCAAMVVRNDAIGDSLVAFWVPTSEQRTSHNVSVVHVDEQHLRRLFQHLEESLPAYMVPSMAISISKMPLTSQGKLDKRLLGQCHDELSTEMRNTFSRHSDEDNKDEDEAWTEDELVIVETLFDTLRIAKVDIKRTTPFFVLGLNSVNSISFARSLEERLHRRFTVEQILRNPTPARIARTPTQPTDPASGSGKLARDISRYLSHDLLKSVAADYSTQGLIVDRVLPCTPLQEVMLSSSGSSKESAYCNTTVLEVSADLMKLKACWEELVQRHEILRTVFVETDMAEHPYAQVVLDRHPLPWHWATTTDDGGRLPSDREAEDSSRIDLAHPFRIIAYQSRSQSRMVLRMHHAVYDGVSMSVLLEEAEKIYYGQSLPPRVRFDPFLKEMLLQNSEESRSFWASKLRDFLPKPFPIQNGKLPSRECHLERMLAADVSSLQAFCVRQGVTALSVFQAALAKVMSNCQATSDICFGNVVSGRSVPQDGIDRLVAPCFNTIPIRMDLSTATTHASLIQQLHQSNIKLLEFQLTPLRRLQALTQMPHLRLFDTLLLVQPPSRELDASIWKLVSEEGSMDMPLVVEVVPHFSNYRLVLHHNPPQVSSELAEALALAFSAAVDNLMTYASSSVTDFAVFDRYSISGRLKADPRVTSTDSEGRDTNATVPEDATWSTEEKQVRQVFASLARVDESRIRQYTTMYQLGLDSLNAAQVAARLRSKGLQVDATDVIERLTPSGIASGGHEQTQAKSREKPEAIFDAFDASHRDAILQFFGVRLADVEAIRPCTAVQSGMLAQSLSSAGSLYINHITYGVPDAVTEPEIQHAWGLVQEKQPILRTAFHQLEDARQPFAMVVLNDCATPVSSAKASDYRSSQGKTDGLRQIAQEIVSDLRKPAWRVSIYPAENGTTMRVSMHHALFDGASLQLLLQDFGAAIRNDSIGRPRSIDPVLSFILNAAEDSSRKSEDYWRTTLEHASVQKFPDLQPMVVQHNELQVTTHRSQLQPSQLEQACREASATVQAFGQAAWALLLAAYLGEPMVTFGTIFSAQLGPDTDAAAFPSITTVPVVCDTAQSMEETLQSMVTYNSATQRHRFASLADIQRFAGSVDRRLFDTVFVYQKTAGSNLRDFSWPVLHETAAVDYAASMELEIESSGTVQLRLTVDSGRIPEAHALLMLRQYDYILMELIGQRKSQDSDISGMYSIMPPKSPVLPSTVDLLHEFVEERARMDPDSPALEFVLEIYNATIKRKVWSYRQLDEFGNQVAHLLLQHGVRPGGIVAVCMEKSAEASLAFLGILKAGCSFLAMDPDLPLARRKFILEDSKASLLFVNGERSHSDLEIRIPIVDLEEASFTSLPTTPPDVGTISPSAVSYNLYTSGTTGNPKGCELTHANAVQAMQAFQRLFAGHWDSSSRWLQFASYWFDVSVLEQFWSWSVGITVVGAPRDIVLDDLATFIRRLNITHIDLTPSLARLLSPDEVPSLHRGVFITGGEALRQEIINTWGPKMVICNGYGPTEATIGVTMNRFIGPDAKPSNIGPPFDNVGAYVLTPETDEPVLCGAVGELCVSGKLVGKGYLKRPDLTAKSFPYLSRLQTRVYRTGDLVRLLADGSISFIGRQDTQAKLRGQRLEIGEIDSILKSSSDEVTDAMSMVIKTGEGERETLVSFLVTDSVARPQELKVNTTKQAQQLVSSADSACRSRLPPYMVPTHIVPVSLLPLTVNNKVDTKKLIALYSSLTTEELQQLGRSSAGQRPLDSTGHKIGSVLSKFLGVDLDQLSQETNIFSLGLSSVSAITFATLLKRAGLAAASVNVIMTNPTVGELSRALADGRKQDYLAERNQMKQAQLSLAAFDQRYRSLAATKLSVTADAVETVMPCTALQSGLLLESLRRDERPYFNTFQYTVNDVDLDRLHAAFDKLTTATQMLRTRFIQTDDGFAQVVLRNAQLPFYDSSASSSRNVDKQRWLDENSSDLLHPVEVYLLQTKAGCTMKIFIHHALYDGISWNLLLDCLAKTYQDGRLPEYGPNMTTAFMHGPLRSRDDAKAFWQERLAGFQFAPLKPSSEATNDNGAAVATIQVTEINKLESVRKTLGVSHQALLQACFDVALQQHYRQTQIYGTVVSGRSFGLDGVDRVIGPLFNTLPSAIAADSADTWTDYAKRCHTMNGAVLPYQHTPLRDIRRWCDQGPSDPMFDVLFVFQHEASQAHELWREVEQEPRADYPLSFEVTLQDGYSMTATVVAQKHIVDEGAAQSLLQSFTDALRCACESRDHQIRDSFTWSGGAHKAIDRPRTQATDGVNGVSDFHWTSDATALRKLLAQVAGVDLHKVNEHSTIFALGIDSIEAVKLASRAKNAGLLIPVSKILQAQTIPRMLQVIAQNKASFTNRPTRSRLAAIEQQLNESVRPGLSKAADIERILPATPNQEALVADMLRSDFKEYYNHDVLLLDPSVDLAKLQAAWQQVVDRNPILRTGFVQVDDPDIDVAFAQVVHRPGPVDFKRLSASSPDDMEALLQSITHTVKSHSGNASPLRLSLVKIQGNRYLIVSLSHAQYDGHSLALLHDDVHRAYQDELQVRPSYTELIEQSLAATSDEARNFWRNTLSGARASGFHRTDPSDAPATTYRDEIASQITPKTARSVCQKHGVSMQAFAETCWSLVLACYTRSPEVIFGVVLACRDSDEAEQIMFPAMNTIAMRAALHGSRKEMLQYMQSMITDIRPYQRTPLRLIQAAFAETDRSTNPRAAGGLFDTLFIYQHRPEATDDSPLKLYESVGGSSNVEYPVAVEIEAVADKLILRAACKDVVFDAQGTHQLLQHLDMVLKAVVDAPEEPTVTFTDDGFSICELPSVHMEDESDDLMQDSEPPESLGDDSDELNPTAATIRDVLAQVSKVPADTIASTAPVESIGIDSISAIKVASLLRKQSITLSVSEIIRARSIKRMADMINAKDSRSSQDNEKPAAETVSETLAKRGLTDVSWISGVDQSNVETVLPATAGQMYMLSVWLHSGGQLFYPTFRYRLGSGIHSKQIKAAWSALIERHGILRTVFAATGDAQIPVVQVVLKETRVNFYLGNHTQEQHSSVQPLVALRVREQDNGHLLELDIHHALYDAVSLPLLIQDFESLLRGSEPRAQELTQADLLALSITDESQQARKSFWESYLQAANQLAKLHQPQSSAAAAAVQKRVELFKPSLFTDCAALEQIARREGVTIQSLLFAAYAKVYTALATINSAESQKSEIDVVLGIYLANRSHLSDLDTLATPTVNLVPLLVRAPQQQKSVVSVAKQVQADLQAIGGGAGNLSAVGLWEVEEWTEGVRVDTFVNFLKVPGKGDSEEEEEREMGRSGGGVELVEIGERSAREYARVVETERGGEGFAVPKELEGLRRVQGAYQFSLDIEATVANGALDVGVFCPEEMLGLEGAEKITSDLKRSFEELLAEAKE